MNLPIGPGWIVGLLLETAPVQFRFENTTKLINCTVGGLVSGQQLVEFSNVVRRKRSPLPDGFSHKFGRILMIFQDFDEILRIAVCGSAIDQFCDEAVFYEGLGRAAVNIV